RDLHSFPTRRSSDLKGKRICVPTVTVFQEHGEARPCLMQPLLIFCSYSWPFFLLGWVVGLACARATFNTGMFMMKLLLEHKIVYNSTKFFIDLASSFCCQSAPD